MRKKSLLLAAGLLLSVYSFAQLNIIRKHGGSVINDSTITINGLSSGLITDSLYVIDTGASGVNVDVKLNLLSIVAGSDNYFCWGANCFAPGVTRSRAYEGAISIGAKDTNKTFYCDYNPAGNVGMTSIRYVFYNDADTADSAWVVIQYNATLTGVQNIAGENIIFSAPYPNPATSAVNISYNLSKGVTSANLKIYNLLGECIQALPVSALKNKTTIDVQSMPSGIYVCAIAAPGSQTIYQKLIVSH